MRKNHVVLIGTAFIAAIAASLVCTSCEKLEFWKNGPKIGFNVTAQGTKAAAITTEGLEGEANFALIAVNDESYVDNADNSSHAAGFYFKSIVKYEGTPASWVTYNDTGSVQTDYMWISGHSMHFWSYYPLDGDVDSAAEGLRTITTPSAGSDTLSFTYAQPTHKEGFDATNQKDLIFAGNEETRGFDKDGKITSYTSSNTGYEPDTKKNDVDIKFYHALSEIKFAVSTTDGTFDNNLIIKSIQISDVYSSGKCKFTLPSTFAWSDSDYGATKSYSQNVNADFSSSTPSTWPLNSTNGLNIYNNSFFMIPQTLDAFAEITVTFQYLDSDGNYQNVDRSFSIGGEEWKAGYYYTYKIKASSVGQDILFSIFLVEWEDENLAVLV